MFPIRLRHRIVLAGMLLVGFAAPAWARVYSPRIISNRTVDAYSARTFAAHPEWRDLPPAARAKAMFDYLTEQQTGLFPFGAGVVEAGEKSYEFGLVQDPIKVLNVYGYGNSVVFGPALAGLWEQGGSGQARTVRLSDLKHDACEVLAEGRWRYLDLDWRGVFLSPSQGLVSLDEARRDPSLWQQPRGPRFFPTEDLEKLSGQIANSRVEYRDSVASGGHTLDYVLRRGETFTRWWQPQGGRWLLGPDDAKDKSRIELLEREPRGPKSQSPEFSAHSHGNGQFVYQPDLKQSDVDFEDGVFDSSNVQVTDAGLTLAKGGDGWAIFEVRSPYVIVPLVGKLDDPRDDKEASVVEVDGTDVTLAWSPDFGDSWITLEPKQWPAVVDLTPQVAGSYGYLLKVGLKGKPGVALLRSLKMTTWVQIAPAALPAVKTGENHFEVKTGDHYGLKTRLLSIQPNAADENSFLHYLVRAPRDYDPASRSARAKGSMIARLPALPQTRIAWFSAGASFGMGEGAEAKSAMNSIEFAVNAPREFHPLFQEGHPEFGLRRPASHAGGHYNIDREKSLDRPADVVFVRFTGNPALNSYRLFAHCLETAPKKISALRVTHTWTEAGQPREHSQVIDAEMARYQINAGQDPVNVSIRLQAE